jgi:hypothetical protein
MPACTCDYATGECQAPTGCKAVAEIERLRAAERTAFTAGFWVFCGPSTNAEHAALDKQEQEAWEAYRSEQKETEKP